MSVNGATQRKLTTAQAHHIRGLFYEDGYTPSRLAGMYGVSESAVWLILRHQTYRNPSEVGHSALITHYQYDFAGSDDLQAWAERVTQQRHRESVARALGGR